MLFLAASAAGTTLAEERGLSPLLRIGLLTDLHYGDKPAAKTRFYREALPKLEEAVACFEHERPAFVVELGDIVDQAEDVRQEINWLRQIEAVYARLSVPRHYVLGNHCVGTLTKAEFRANTGSKEQPHYVFDQASVRFVVLDACFRSDGVPYERQNFDWRDAFLPPLQVAWLREQLATAGGPVIILAHQRLDEGGRHSVINAAAVRQVLEASGKVLAVFQGHSHQNDYQQIRGIHYCTLAAMIEGSGLEQNGYALLEIMPDYSLRLRGYRRQMNRQMPRTRQPPV